MNLASRCRYIQFSLLVTFTYLSFIIQLLQYDSSVSIVSNYMVNQKNSKIWFFFRLEGLNKRYKTNVIISEETRNSIQPRMISRPLEYVVVKGKYVKYKYTHYSSDCFKLYEIDKKKMNYLQNKPNSNPRIACRYSRKWRA